MKNSPPVHGGRFLSQNQFGRPAREDAHNTPVRDLAWPGLTAGPFLAARSRRRPESSMRAAESEQKN